jgi:GNAT superfamily N-acetyltransferase
VVDALPLPDLSDHFNAFLPHFMKEALRCGGEVWVTSQDRDIDGVFIYHEAEKLGSIFSRQREVAEELFRLKEHPAVFSDFDLAPASELYHIYAAEHPGWPGSHRFAHSVRTALPTDRPAIVALMKDVYGRVDERWLETPPRPGEACFVVDGVDQLAGAAWASVARGHGRLHSLSVRTRYRRTGIGSDLWFARMGWTRQAGAGPVVSEISEHNLASRAIAVAGGMTRVGQIYQSRRP